MDHTYLFAMVSVAFTGLLIAARSSEGAITARSGRRSVR
jgi:hypothetical protein